MNAKANFSKVALPLLPWHPVVNPTPGHLPLVATGRINSNDGNLQVQLITLAKEAGLNIIQCGLYAYDNFRDSLERAAAAGMKVIIQKGLYEPDLTQYSFNPPTEEAMAELKKVNPYDHCWDDTINELQNFRQLIVHARECVESGRKNPLDALAGINLRDEPVATQMWIMARMSQIITKWYRDNGFVNIPYIGGNLFPDQLTGSTGTGLKYDCNHIYAKGMNSALNYLTGYSEIKSYDDYVELYTTRLNPALLTFDAYPFRKEPVQQKSTMRSFFTSLIYFQNRKKTKVIDFWATVLCCHVKNSDGTNDHLFPTLGRMRFEAFISLMYGASGLIFWKFAKQSTDKEGSDTPLTPEGNTNPNTFPAVKSLVNQIKAIESIILSSNIALTAVTKAPPGTNLDEILGIMALTSANNFGVLQSISSSGAGFVLAHVYNSSYNYIFVASMEVQNSQCALFTFIQENDIKDNVYVLENFENVRTWKKLTASEVASGKSFTFDEGDLKIFRYPR